MKRRNRVRAALIGALSFGLLGISAAPQKRITILSSIPHSTQNFTQGLILMGDTLVESTGSPGGGSRVIYINTKGGSVLKTVGPFHSFFGEGIARVGQTLYQISWQNGSCFRYRLPDLSPYKPLSYSGEGWGLTSNRRGELFMSDGTSTIVVRSPKDFRSLRRISVTLDGVPLDKLNELELVGDTLFANRWYDNLIYAINVKTGAVLFFIDATPLVIRAGADVSAGEVVNGIAYAGGQKFYLTGKLWSKIFLVEIGK